MKLLQDPNIASAVGSSLALLLSPAPVKSASYASGLMLLSFMKLPTIPAMFSSLAPGTLDLRIRVRTAILSLRFVSDVVFPPCVVSLGVVEPEPDPELEPEFEDPEDELEDCLNEPIGQRLLFCK